MKATESTLIVVLTLAATIAVAQNHPQPEVLVATLDINKTTLPEVERKFGSPLSTVDGYRGPNKIRSYEWQEKEIRIRIVKLMDPSLGNGFFSIEVWGSHNENGYGISGEGLRLGDRLNDAQHIYGRRLRETHFSSAPGRPFGSSFLVSIGPEAPTLEIGFDRSGLVTHMKLTNPCVPFCF
jgi:hypothetical protein